MGTSSIYGGQKDKKSLLPDDFEDLKNEENINNEMPWKDVKTAMSQYATGRSKGLSGVVKKYIRASGGAKNLAKNSKSGVKSTAALGQFLASIRQKGLNQTLKEFNIEFQGRTLENVLSDIVNVIAKGSNLKEECVAKNACINTLEVMYELVEESGLNLESLESMNDDIFETLMCNYVSEYIWESMLNDLESRLEQYADNPTKALEIENDFKDYIKNSVEVTYKSKDIKVNQFSNKEIDIFVENLYKDCYEVLGGEL